MSGVDIAYVYYSKKELEQKNIDDFPEFINTLKDNATMFTDNEMLHLLKKLISFHPNYFKYNFIITTYTLI